MLGIWVLERKRRERFGSDKGLSFSVLLTQKNFSFLNSNDEKKVVVFPFGDSSIRILL